ncbi:MAG TPA: CpsB/CapC family capsule biosynthesis tyrosine phosphatase [Candidatus Saccharimonadales bacterium]|nr:CpsB/CapC family capsule biosynthesis tyrosine phosphatase [Candidatus Saccharimonadales bacterium]
MVDLHCHILPGLDDGAKTIDDSLAMAEDAIADGITHVVGTPHASPDYGFDYRRVQAACAELTGRLGGRLTIATGCDFHLSHENLVAIRRDPHSFCLNQHDYLLVEFNEFSIPPSMDQTLHELQLAGLRPIVTHPERNGILRTHPERLERWVRHGSFVQVTAGSLTGVFGPGPQADAWAWIGRGLVHFICSDAHNTGRRPLKLKFAYDSVTERLGEEAARRYFFDNPLAAFEGRPLPYVPEVAPPAEPRRRKRFLFF